MAAVEIKVVPLRAYGVSLVPASEVLVHVVYCLSVHCNVVSVSVVQLVIGESCHFFAVCILCRRWRKPS